MDDRLRCRCINWSETRGCCRRQPFTKSALDAFWADEQKEGHEPAFLAPAPDAAPELSTNQSLHLISEQEPPKPSSAPAAWDLVLEDVVNLPPSAARNLMIADMRARDAEGEKKYGVRLTPGNGRDCMVDAYQEALDGAVYLRAAAFLGEDCHSAYWRALELARDIRRIILRRDGR